MQKQARLDAVKAGAARHVSDALLAAVNDPPQGHNGQRTREAVPTSNCPVFVSDTP